MIFSLKILQTHSFFLVLLKVNHSSTSEDLKWDVNFEHNKCHESMFREKQGYYNDEDCKQQQ